MFPAPLKISGRSHGFRTYILYGMVLEDIERDSDAPESDGATGGSWILDGCRRGDADAFRALFEKHKDMVYSIALRYSGDAATAQDIAQDTFVKLFSAIGSFRGDSNFESWLYRMVVNCCFDRRRKSRRMMPLLDEALSLLRTPDVNALEEMLRSELSAHVRQVVDSLAPDQRMAIVLRYTQGLTYDEMAAILECAPGTVASRLNRAHKVLERRLARFARKESRNV